MNSDTLTERIAQVEGGPIPTGNNNDDPRNPGKESQGASPPPPDLAEVEEFLLDGLMGATEWAYEARAAVAGLHWKLEEAELATIRKPAARVVAKWAPRLVNLIPGFALRWRDEITLCMVLFTVTKGRVMIDRQLAAEASAHAPTTGGSDDGR